MWNSIPTSGLLAGAAILALSGCGPGAPDAPPPTASPSPTAAPGPAAAGEAVLSGQIDEPVEPAAASAVVEQQDIVVDGQPACAIEVRYAGLQDQPVTWRGEPCAKLTVRFLSLAELTALGQDGKLGPEALEDLARLPGGKALYVEGEYASALFPANVMERVYRVPLAD